MISKDMPQANGKGLAKLSSLVIGLQSHKYDGILMDAATAKAYASNNSNLYAFNSKLPVTAGGIALAFPKGDTSLVNAANQTIKTVNGAWVHTDYYDRLSILRFHFRNPLRSYASFKE